MDRVVLRQLSAWMGFVAVITIISGVISVVTGLFTFILGAIPGIITIVLGVKLRNAKHYLDDIIMVPAGADYSMQLNMFATNLNTYFKIQGVLIIIIIVLIIIIFFLVALLGMAFFSVWG